jgi:hypothetical protein
MDIKLRYFNLQHILVGAVPPSSELVLLFKAEYEVVHIVKELKAAPSRPYLSLLLRLFLSFEHNHHQLCTN